MGKEKKKKKKSGTEPGREVRHHSVWDNYRVAFSWMREIEGTAYFFIQGLEVVLAVIQPFMAMALPGAVVYLLGSGWEPGRIFPALAGYVLILQGMHVAGGYLSGKCKKKQMLLRIKLGTQLFGASMDADYRQLESDAGQKKLTAAGWNLYYGNDKGIEAFLKVLGSFLTNLAGLLLYSVVIGRQSPVILGLSLLVAGVAACIHTLTYRQSVEYDEKYEEIWREYNKLGQEVLASAHGKDIRLYHMWNWFSGEFEKLKKEFVWWGNKWWKCCKRNASLAEKCLAFVRDLLVYGYLIRRMMQGDMELSAFLIYVGVAAGFGNWMTPLLDAFNAIMENNKYMGDYRAFLEFAGNGAEGGAAEALPASETAGDPGYFKRRRREEDNRVTDSREKDGCPVKRDFLTGETAGKPHEIRLDHVSFRYEGNEEDTIHDLSLTITAGEKVALVGVNGAGKSTLIKLICGLYRPTSGRIYLDGRDVTEFPVKDYYKEFAVVFQDVFAFSFPLADNVTCRDTASADRERLQASLQKAGLWEKVQSLENREQTYMNRDLDPSGVQLSGGELQRLMLARALYKEAPVLILDEPTAALDPIAESRLYEKYYDMTREKTSIFISHRLSSTKFCDRILFLENGRITEEGRHEELLAGNGAYASMYHTQAQYYQSGTAGEDT